MDRKVHKDLAGQMPELVYQEHYIDKTKGVIDAEERLLDALDEMVIDLELTKGDPKDPRVSKAFHEVRQQVVQSKRDYCCFLLRRILNEAESRVVVFSFYKEPLYDLQALLAISGVCGNAVTFTGDESAEQKEAAIQKFNTTSRVLLCSNAGARGLDLPDANYVVHLDIPFSHGILDQRNKRITRANSKSKFAVVNYLLVKDSIEEFYFEIVRRKGDLAAAVYTGDTDKITIRPASLRTFLHET